MVNQATLEKPELSSSAPLPKRRPNWLVLGFEFLAIVVVGLLLLEPLMTLAGVNNDEFQDFNPSSGWSPLPNRTYVTRSEGYGGSTINSLGMADKERTLEKPPNTYRMAVLGCSQTQGDLAPMPERFTRLVEDQLNAEGGPVKYEVLNFGVSAFSIGQEYVRLRDFTLKFKPDLVLFNARPNSLLYMGPYRAKGVRNSRPIFGIMPDGTLVEDRHFQHHWMKSGEFRFMQDTRWLRFNSRLWKLTSKASYALNEAKDKTINSVLALFHIKAPTQDQPEVPSLMGQKLNPAQVEAMKYLGRVAEVIILKSRELCQKQNCKFMLVYLPAIKSTRDDREAAIYHEFAARNHLNFVDFNPQFDEIGKDPKKKLFRICHFDAEGHRALAALITQELKKQNLLYRAGATKQ
ncbi:MAG: hypothetical protein C0507_22775 [Cyanobacteria bacterium PR.3.49]|nr:hypothetical protein [Cyanobacteria bacterium PR.3.49]